MRRVCGDAMSVAELAVDDIYSAHGERRAKLRIGARIAEGVVTAVGDAVIALN
jgi:hypothetical protein